MINNREKVGDATEHKLSAANMVQLMPKTKRLVLPFGAKEQRRRDVRETEHEHYIREIPLAGGGLGCALWDGGLVLARWVHHNGAQLFRDKTVLELGCGVGLAGILAAHWATHVTLTDYIEDTVRNAWYNAKINSADEDDEDDADAASSNEEDNGAQGDKEEETTQQQHKTQASAAAAVVYRRMIIDRMCARMLDWDEELHASSTPATAANDNGTQPTTTTSSDGGDGKNCCTGIIDHLSHRAHPTIQPWLRCLTCWPTDASKGVCVPCAEQCHATHELVQQAAERFLCDCATSDILLARASDGGAEARGGACTAVPPQPPMSPVDVIIGSELTYNLLSCASLAFVVDKYLAKPHGVFYEVLSNDRDGVTVFIEEMERRGFETTKHAAPDQFVGNFGTRKWSKQNEESYSFYTWRRRDCPPELMAAVMQ